MAFRSHGTGRWAPTDLAQFGSDVVVEEGVLIFNAAHVHVGNGVYLGHRAMLKGDTRGELRIGDETWIGQDVYISAAAGVTIGRRVGLGPGLKILTSTHADTPWPRPIIDAPLEMQPVAIGDGCDVGVNAVILPGVQIGVGVQIAAGAVVASHVPDGAVAAGVPARVIRYRGRA